MGTMSSYGLCVNIGTMMSIAHGGYGAWARGEMANTGALATAQSGDMCGDTMKYYGPSVLDGLGGPVSAHNLPGLGFLAFTQLSRLQQLSFHSLLRHTHYCVLLQSQIRLVRCGSGALTQLLA